MVFKIRAVPRSSAKLVKQDGARLKIYLTKPACDGLANEQLLELLAAYLKVKKYRLKIIRGEKSRDKLVELDENA